MTKLDSSTDADGGLLHRELHWPSSHGPANTPYGSMAAHLRDGLRAHGWNESDDAPIAMHIGQPDGFKPTPGRFNVLLTMCEGDSLSHHERTCLRRADYIVTPSRFCRHLFAASTDATVEIVPLGVDAETFAFTKRVLSKPFRWLWVGTPTHHHGLDVLHSVWNRYFADTQGAELYLKTTGTDTAAVRRRGNVVLDGRNLTPKQLAELYQGAHGFVFPTQGEGWGMTLHEAMATGVPCIVTRYSGLLDFTDEDSVCYVGWDREPTTTDSGRKVRTAHARPGEVAHAMASIMLSYGKALAMGRRGMEKAQPFTWGRAAGALDAILTGQLLRLA